MRKKLTSKGLLNVILKAVRSLFSLMFNPSYYNIITMENFKYKFKPLGFKILAPGSNSSKTLQFDYVYNDVVYCLIKDISGVIDINFEVQPIDNIMIILGGYSIIKECTEFMINENINKLKF